MQSLHFHETRRNQQGKDQRYVRCATKSSQSLLVNSLNGISRRGGIRAMTKSPNFTEDRSRNRDIMAKDCDLGNLGMMDLGGFLGQINLTYKNLKDIIKGIGQIMILEASIGKDKAH